MSRLHQGAKNEGSRFLLYFGPTLDALRALGGSGTPDEVVEAIAQELKVPDDVQNGLLPSGEPRFRNQVAWARLQLVREGLFDSSRRGVWSLTDRRRTTSLTLQDARAIRTKWVRIFQAKRTAASRLAGKEPAYDSTPEPETFVRRLCFSAPDVRNFRGAMAGWADYGINHNDRNIYRRSEARGFPRRRLPD
jgi:restriction system protein